jgi:hypothetical protein
MNKINEQKPNRTMAQPLIEKIWNAGYAKKNGFPTKLAYDTFINKHPQLQEKIDDEYAPLLEKTANKIRRDFSEDLSKMRTEITVFATTWVQPKRAISKQKSSDEIDIDMYPEISELCENLKTECAKHGIVASIKLNIATV